MTTLEEEEEVEVVVEGRSLQMVEVPLIDGDSWPGDNNRGDSCTLLMEDIEDSRTEVVVVEEVVESDMLKKKKVRKRGRIHEAFDELETAAAAARDLQCGGGRAHLNSDFDEFDAAVEAQIDQAAAAAAPTEP